MLKRFEFQITTDNHRQRLDEFLFERFSEIGKKFLRGVLKEGKCEVNGYLANGGIILKTNDFVEIEFDHSAQNRMFPEKIALDILFEDSELIILNKPVGILVHPTPRERTGTLLNGLVFHLNDDGSKPGDERLATPEPNLKARDSKFRRPGLVHRLDRETSGLMVIAKTPRALRVLNSHFKRKLVEKKYLAVVEGVVGDDAGEVAAPIGRYEDLRIWNVKTDGKDSLTRYSVLERSPDATLVALEPVTGRTNQLRVHMAFMGHPILGDKWHGLRQFPRLCLHAAELSFWHPDGGERMEFKLGLPPSMLDWKTENLTASG